MVAPAGGVVTAGAASGAVNGGAVTVPVPVVGSSVPVAGPMIVGFEVGSGVGLGVRPGAVVVVVGPGVIVVVVVEFAEFCAAAVSCWSSFAETVSLGWSATTCWRTLMA